MFGKKIFSLLGLLFIGNRITSVYSEEVCNVNSTKNCIANSYYLVNKIDYSPISTTNTEGTLYYCKGEPVQCNEIEDIGYYIVDKDNYYTCQNGINGFACIKSDPIGEGVCRSQSNNIGKLVVSPTDHLTISLCLNDSNSDKAAVDLNSSNSGDYLISKNIDSTINVFGITGNNEKYAIITIKDKIITLNSAYSNNLKYVYALDESRKVMKKNDGSCSKDASGVIEENKILEVFCTKGKCKDAESELVISGASDGINVYKLVDGKPGALGTNDLKKDGIESVKTSLRMYNCKDEKCDLINGYILTNTGSSDIYYAITGSGAVKVERDDEATCTKDNIGEVITLNGSAFNICLDEDLALPVAAGKYILGDGKGKGPFASDTKKMIEVDAGGAHIYVTNSNAENNNNYIIKVGDDYLLYKYIESGDIFERDMDLSDVKVFKESGTTYAEYGLTDTSAITEDSQIVNWKVFDCADGECFLTYGYVKSENSNFFSLSSTGNAIITGESSCTVANTGKLLSTGELCVEGNGTPASAITSSVNDSKYLVKNTARNVYKGTGDGTSKLLIKRSSNAFTLDIVGKSIHVWNVKNNAVRSVNFSSDQTKNFIYSCTVGNICNQINGYILNTSDDEYYITSDGTTTSYPVSVEVSTDATNYCEDSIGKMVKDASGHKYLCLDKDLSIDVSIPGDYVLGTIVSGSPFTSSKIIKVTEDYAIVDSDFPDENGYYLVKLDDDNYKIYTYENVGDTFSAATTEGMTAFKTMSDYDNLYSDVSNGLASITDATDLNDVTLYKCKKGNCKRSEGFVLINTNTVVKKCNLSHCNNDPGSEVTQSCSSNDGKIKIDTSALKLCLGNAAKDSPATYFVGSSFKMYILSSTTIVGTPIPENGYYLMKADNSMETTTGSAITDGKLLKFVDGTCTSNTVTNVVTTAGYYINAGGYKTISCTASTNCKLENANLSGYYVDVDKNLFFCDVSYNCDKVINPVGYYIDAKTNGNIIKCNDAHECVSEVGSTLPGHAYLDASDYKRQSLITCPSSPPCTTSSVEVKALTATTDKAYFIDGSNPTRLIVCSGNGTAQKGRCADTLPQETVLAFYKDAKTAANTITCSASGCLSSKALTKCHTVTSSSQCKYDNSGTADNLTVGDFCIHTDGKIYKSVSSSSCVAQPKGIYLFIDDSGLYKAGLIGTDTPGLMYSCDDSSCSQLVNSAYLDTASHPTYIYNCDAGTCTKSNSVNSGDYILSGLNTIHSTKPFIRNTNLIYCSSDIGTCVPETSVGYFIKATDDVWTGTKVADGVEYVKIAKPTTKCSATYYGKLGLDDSTGAVLTMCLNETPTEGVLASDGSVVVSYASNNIFGLTSGQKAIVKLTANSVILQASLPACTVTNVTLRKRTNTDQCKLTTKSTPELKENKYCIKGKQIYKSGANDGKNCALAYGENIKDEGIIAFDIKDPLNPVVADLSTTLSSPYLVLYDCAYGECHQTYGFVVNNNKVYQSSPSGFMEVTSSVENTACTSKLDVGKVKYSSSTFKVCVMRDIVIGTDGSPTLNVEWKTIGSTLQNHYVIKPEAKPSTGKFVGDYEYFNFIALKVQPNIVAVTKRSPALPVCDSTCKLQGSSSAIASGELCIDAEGTKIYKNGGSCKVAYGSGGTAEAPTGIKIFQKGATFNQYTEPSNFDAISPTSNELHPFFVIYDCSSEGCTQTSGFVMYKQTGDTDPRFINCFTGKDVNPSTNALEDMKHVVGCIPLLNDGKTVPSCENNDADTERATYGLYDYSSPNFNMCANIKVANNGNAGDYKTQSLSIRIGTVGQFFFTSGYTPFSNTLTTGNAFVKIRANSATLARTVTPGYYINAGSIYSGENTVKDALIKCTSTGLSTCSAFDISSKLGYYLNAASTGPEDALLRCYNNSGTKVCVTVDVHEYTDAKHYIDVPSKRLITCTSEGCKLRPESLKGYFLNSDVTTGAKKVIQCTGTANDSCSTVTTESGNTDLGKVNVSGNTISLCVKNACGAGEGDKVTITSATSISYVSITLADADHFPGAPDTSIVVKVRKDNSAVLLENVTLPTCKGNPSSTDASATCKDKATGNPEVPYCIYSDSKIYKTGTSTCNPVAATTDKIYYFTRDYDAIDPDDITTGMDTIAMAYSCGNGSDTVANCKLVKGYIIEDGHLITCSSVNDEACTVTEVPTATDCTSAIEGSIVSSTLFCISSGATATTLANGVTQAFVLKGASDIYGKSKDEYIFIQLSTTFAMLTEQADSTKYLVKKGDDLMIIESNEYKALSVYTTAGSHCVNNRTLVATGNGTACNSASETKFSCNGEGKCAQGNDAPSR